jgi:DNA-binding response OmpR family regulator
MPSTVLTNDTRVLIIDDDKSILQILSKILRKNGFSVDTAQSGQEAMRKLAAKTYSAALIDVRLQDTNGLDLLNQIQKIAPQMRKIILTGYPSDEDRIKAIERGADYYLAKPVNSEKLVEIIRDKTRKDKTSNF